MDALTELALLIARNNKKKRIIEEACKGQPVCCPPKSKGMPNFDNEGRCIECGSKL